MLLDAGRDLLLGVACAGCGRPGRVLCRGCETALPRAGRPAWPTPTPAGLAPPWAAGDYDDPLRRLLLAHKEHGVLGLAAPLGRVLADVVADHPALDGWSSHARLPTGPVWLVPVPSRPSVVRGRGHDPMLRVSRHAAGRLRSRGVPARVRPLLVTRGGVRDQAGLSAAQRAANLAGAMRVRGRPRDPPPPPLSPPPALLLIVDDVLTTGATAREAQRALERGGWTVHGVAVVAATVRQDSRLSLPFARGDV